MTNTQIHLFATVGVSTKNGDTTKFRFTNRGAEAYGDILVKEGHTNVQFVDLADPLSKADAIAEFVKQFPDYAELRIPGIAADKPARAPRAAKEPGAARSKKSKTVELTAEQIAAAKAASKRAADAARKRAARSAKNASENADANLDAALAALDAATETTQG